MAELTGRAVRIVCRPADEPEAPAATTPPPPRGGRTPAPRDKSRSVEVAEQDEFVQRIAGLFEARVVKVTDLGGATGGNGSGSE